VCGIRTFIYSVLLVVLLMKNFEEFGLIFLLGDKGIMSESLIIISKIKKIKSAINKIKIKKNMGWCDDPKSNSYNREIKLPTKFGYEKLYRKDCIYDLIAVTSYNSDPIVKNKGSAIFLHIAKKEFAHTQGCIALKKKDLLFLLSKISKKTKIKIC
jgi:L,D-peptidoglycan transpeptidase YkuD (ErfK/YbiS/YcfS/YnhG family)